MCLYVLKLMYAVKEILFIQLDCNLSVCAESVACGRAADVSAVGLLCANMC